MKAVVKYKAGVGNVELREVPEPELTDNQVKIEVEYCGICGTDLHVYHDRFRNYPPVVLGHEFAGTVVETGLGVNHVVVGDLVTVLPASAVTCGVCYYCRQGQFMFCPERRGMGHGVNGAFTRYVTARNDQVYKLPQNLSLEVAAMCEPFAAAVHAVAEKAVISSGDVVLLTGPGPIGLMCLKMLVDMGVRTIVSGTSCDQLRLDMAKKLGASVIVNVEEDDLQDVVHEETEGRGVDVAIECSGAAAGVRSCLDALRPCGRLTQVGHFGKSVEINYDWVAYKELEITGSVGYTAATWDRVMRILSEGKIDLADMISHKLPIDDWKNAFEICEQKQGMKVLLHYGEGSTI